MFKSLPTYLLIQFTVIAGLGIASPAIGFAEVFKVPQYNGEILPINSPIIMRYRPHHVSKLTAEKRERYVRNGDATNVTTISDGEVKQISKGSDIEAIYKINEIETTANGESKLEKKNLSMILRMESTGKFKDLDFVGFDLGKSKDEVLKLLKPLMKQAFPEFSENGVSVGDVLYDGNSKTQLGSVSFSFSFNGIVQGRSRFNGRDVLVATFDGSIQMDLKGFVMEGPIQGYTLMDIDTGATLLSDGFMRIKTSDNGESGFSWDTREVKTIKFPPKMVINKSPEKQGLSYRLERVKELLEQNLITPQEAKEKRKDILKGL